MWLSGSVTGAGATEGPTVWKGGRAFGPAGPVRAAHGQGPARCGRQADEAHWRARRGCRSPGPAGAHVPAGLQQGPVRSARCMVRGVCQRAGNVEHQVGCPVNTLREDTRADAQRPAWHFRSASACAVEMVGWWAAGSCAGSRSQGRGAGGDMALCCTTSRLSAATWCTLCTCRQLWP